MATVCAVACSQKANENPVPEFKTFEYELIEEGNYSFSISYEHITNTADSEAFALIEEMNYVATFGDYALEKQDLQRSAESLCQEALASMKAFEISGVECEMHLYQVATLIRDNSTVCYDTVIETDFGGVYPIVSHTFECYDLASGNAYDFGYLNDGEWYDTLVETIFNKLDAEYGEKFYIISAEYFYLPQIIYLTDAGIVFQYNPYEIGDAELGSISVELTDAELKATGAPLVWE